MRIFDVVNRSNTGAYIMARDREDAIAVAKEISHVKAKAPKQVIDLTEELSPQLGMRELIAQGYRGRLAKSVRAMSGTQFLEYLRSGVEPPRPPAKWFAMKQGVPAQASVAMI